MVVVVHGRWQFQGGCQYSVLLVAAMIVMAVLYSFQVMTHSHACAHAHTHTRVCVWYRSIATVGVQYDHFLANSSSTVYLDCEQMKL